MPTVGREGIEPPQPKAADLQFPARDDKSRHKFRPNMSDLEPKSQKSQTPNKSQRVERLTLSRRPREPHLTPPRHPTGQLNGISDNALRVVRSSHLDSRRRCDGTRSIALHKRPLATENQTIDYAASSLQSGIRFVVPSCN